MTSSNYLANAVDLDSTYIIATDPNYQGVQAAVTNRKTVVFGQQILSQTYPIGNLNNAMNYAQSIPSPIVDQDSVNITGVGPTAVFYRSRANTSQSLVRGNFNLLENIPQTSVWQTTPSLGNYSSPVQTGSTASNWSQVGISYQPQFLNGQAAALVLQNNGTLWGCGYNGRGKLGNNTTTSSTFFQQVVGPNATGPINSWSQVVSALWALAIQSNGTLWSWGYNLSGECGLGTANSSFSSPMQIGSSLWSKIACGYSSNLAIQTNGTLWAWGQQRWGQLGNGSTAIASLSNPVQIGIQSYWVNVANGAKNSFMIQNNGALWASGDSASGALGNNTTTSFSTPVQVSTISNWSQAACGYLFSIALQSNGTLWSWGRNEFGQLGSSNTTNRSSTTQVGSLSTWVQIACGYQHTVAIQSNGTIWAWGNNSYGQLGLNDVTHRSSPVQIGALGAWTSAGCGAYYTLAVNNGALYGWGNNSTGVFGLTPKANSVTKVTYGL